ncbi:hypothetical protein, conserved [Entamoeba histolytica]
MKYSSLNTIRKINSDIISKLRYGFCIVTWKLGELEKIDKQIRKSLIQLQLYSRNIPKSRLYVKINEMGLGLMSARDECAKELIRIYLKYKWKSSTEIGEMIETIKENPNGIIKRMKKVFGKKINFNELMNIIEINERKHNVKEVFEWVNNELNERYLSEWKEKKCGEYIRCANGTFNDKKLTVATWRSLNIKRNAFLQIVKMQEGVSMTGSIKSKILQNDDLKYCKHCPNTIASISHILLGCNEKESNIKT